MNLIALGFADGTAFFAGLGLLLVSLAILFFAKARLATSLAKVVCIVSLAVILLSATPQPVWEYVVLCVLVVLFLLSTKGFRSQGKWQRARPLSGAGIAVLSLAMAVQEISWHLTPAFAVPPNTQVCVIGDSISAGLGGKDTHLWPDFLAYITSLSVTNLAVPGATAQNAPKQISKIPRPSSVVILEIGGNDMLGNTTPKQFRLDLQTALEKLQQGHHRVLMFELPLFPTKNSFGQAQRELAQKYGVTLLPKRHFTKVLGTDSATLDGLHLSPAGHRLLAEDLASILKKTE